MLKSIISDQPGAVAASSKSPALPASARWALASLSLSMLLSSLGISIANVGLPTLAQVFGASFQQVQWVVLAYLLAITTLIVNVKERPQKTSASLTPRRPVAKSS